MYKNSIASHVRIQCPFYVVIRGHIFPVVFLFMFFLFLFLLSIRETVAGLFLRNTGTVQTVDTRYDFSARSVGLAEGELLFELAR